MQKKLNRHLFPSKTFPLFSMVFTPKAVTFFLLISLTAQTLAQVTPTKPITSRSIPNQTNQPRSSQGNQASLQQPSTRGSSQPRPQQTPHSNTSGQIQQQGITGKSPLTNNPAGNNSQSKPTNRNQVSNTQMGSDTILSEAERKKIEKDETKRQQEEALQERRQKIFGYEIFNNPNYQAVFQPNLQMATPKGYIIGPGDELMVDIFGYSEANYSLIVNPDGYVVIPRVGPVSITGLTIEQAKMRLRDRLSKIYVGLKNSDYGSSNTFMEVRIGTLRSIRVSITGEAIRPGTYTLSSLSTATNAIYEAGGPNEIGSYRSIQVIRNNRVIANLDLYDFLTTGIQKNDIRLQDNDNIRFTTYKSQVEILGTVKRNNIFELTPGETLDRVLYLAGGFTGNAYKARIKITRYTNRELKVIDVLEPEFKSFVMQDGDVIQTEQVLVRYENQITINGAVFRPGNYSLDQNKTLRHLIESADGLRGDAFTGRISITRTRDDMAVENISLNLADIINGIQQDIELKREDVIVIPSKFEMAEFADVGITGEVNNPLPTAQYVANMTLEDLLIHAGGLKESAAAAQIEVVRRKKDVDPTSTSAQIAETFTFNVDRDLSIKASDSKFLLQPYDQVIIRRSPNYQVQTYAKVEGEVSIPGEYPIRSKDQRISDVIKMAGGLTPYAYIEGATLVREVKLSEVELEQRRQTVNELANDTQRATVNIAPITSAKQEFIGINLKKILSNPGSMEDIIIQEGDIVRIPKVLQTVRVQGEVLLPTTVKYRSGQTFQDYISHAGGFTSRSARKRAYVVYANGSADRTRKFGFFNIYPRIEPGSEIIVPQKTTSELTARQIIGEITAISSSVMSMIVAILAFRTIR